MLDTTLLNKIAKKVDKPVKYVREQVSKRATRQGVTSPAALILWARDLKISTALSFRKLEPHIQDQVRTGKLGVATASPKKQKYSNVDGGKATRHTDPILSAMDDLLSDNELKSRCKDLLKRPRHFDRALREATTVLENRIKAKSGIKTRPNPEALVNLVLNPDPAKAILVVSEVSSEQGGFHSICRGIVLAFRHKAHHQLDDKVTREDALKFCAFIDVLLSMIESATLKSPS